jgi:hypothetical protein
MRKYVVMIQVVGLSGMQWLQLVLRIITIENRIWKPWYKGIIVPITRMETGKNVEAVEVLYFCTKISHL